MFRNRVRPPTPPLDEVTAERLLRGDPIEDLPDAYRPLGLLLADATGPATDDELAGSAAAAAQFVAVHQAATEPKRRTRSMAGSVFLAFALAASTGTAVAATQGALPGPVQQVAHEALAAVGISIPGTTSGDDQGAGGDAGDSTPTDGVSTTATPSSTPPGGVGRADVPSPTPAVGPAGPVTAPAVGDDGNSGGGAGEGGGADNPNAGPGNDAGQGNENPGDGNQGNPGTGNDGNQGNQGNQGGHGNEGNQGNPANPGNKPSDPGANPSRSDGKGGGPPDVPPGQTKKLG